MPIMPGTFPVRLSGGCYGEIVAVNRVGAGIRDIRILFQAAHDLGCGDLGGLLEEHVFHRQDLSRRRPWA